MRSRVAVAATAPPSRGDGWSGQLDRYDQELMTAVVTRAEKVGKQVKPLFAPELIVRASTDRGRRPPAQ